MEEKEMMCLAISRDKRIVDQGHGKWLRKDGSLIITHHDLCVYKLAV